MALSGICLITSNIHALSHVSGIQEWHLCYLMPLPVCFLCYACFHCVSSAVRSLPQGCLWCSWLSTPLGNTLSPLWCWQSRLPPPPLSVPSTGHNPCRQHAEMHTHTHKTTSFQFCPCWSYMQSEKLTVRQSSSEWERLRRHRASTVRDGAPSPTGRPLVLTRNVSIRMKSAGRRFPAYSGSTDDGSAPWPRLGRSVSSGVEHSRWNHVSCS